MGRYRQLIERSKHGKTLVGAKEHGVRKVTRPEAQIKRGEWSIEAVERGEAGP